MINIDGKLYDPLEVDSNHPVWHLLTTKEKAESKRLRMLKYKKDHYEDYLITIPCTSCGDKIKIDRSKYERDKGYGRKHFFCSICWNLRKNEVFAYKEQANLAGQRLYKHSAGVFKRNRIENIRSVK